MGRAGYVVPYILYAGRHVQKDVPGEIERWQKGSLHIKIHQLPYVGVSTMMFDLIEQEINQYQNK